MYAAPQTYAALQILPTAASMVAVPQQSQLAPVDPEAAVKAIADVYRRAVADDTLAFDPEAAVRAIADVYRQAVADDDDSDDDGDYNDYDEDGNYEDADEQFVDSDDSGTDEDMPSLETLDLQDCLDDQIDWQLEDDYDMAEQFLQEQGLLPCDFG